MFPEISLPVLPIYSNLTGYSQIAKLYADMRVHEFSRIELDMRRMNWCDGNLCAALGAVLYRIARTPNEIKLTQIPEDVETLLCKNGFMTNYGRAKRSDTYGSTIQYRRFEPNQDLVFSHYIDEQFRSRAIPEMSAALHKKFLEALMEIFSNATIHSETKQGIFVCGQYFHRQQRLDFTIADLGIGFRQNLIKKIGLELPPADAILWAMEGNNTTKQGPIPGGLGLKLLKEFIRLNNGRLQVVSGAGYWQQNKDGHYETATMENSFPGTVVNIEINTADQKSYALSNELDDELPF